jgi:hypothetical protein
MGGMFESGIGRAFNIAIASLPGFQLPADMSPASFYFEHDLVYPSFVVATDGTIQVPQIPGLGFEVDEEYIRAQTVVRTEHTSGWRIEGSIELNEAIQHFIRPDTFPVGVKIVRDSAQLPEKAKRPKRDLGVEITICKTVVFARRYDRVAVRTNWNKRPDRL